MNEVIQKHAEQIALAKVGEKYASGGDGLIPSKFAEDVDTLTEQILALAAAYVTKQADAEPAKARKPRKEKGGGRQGAAIDPEALKKYLQDGQKYPAQVVAEFFKVSKGVAERALNALEGVKSEPGTPEPGKRGKPAKVYFLP